MTGAGNWTWLLRGGVTTLIDAGTGVPQYLDALADALAGVTLDQVIVTHGHGDHASGVIALAERFRGVRFFKLPWPGRDEKWPVAWEPLAAGQTVDAGTTTLEVIHTPGHAPDHICLWHQATRELFCADLAMQEGSVYVPSSAKGGDLVRYLESLSKVIALAPRRMLPAHGPVIDDPATLLRGYVAHRLDRERQIVAAMAAGANTPDEILARIYPGIKPAMVPFARDTILAHLEKIERDRHKI